MIQMNIFTTSICTIVLLLLKIKNTGNRIKGSSGYIYVIIVNKRVALYIRLFSHSKDMVYLKRRKKHSEKKKRRRNRKKSEKNKIIK